MSSYCSTDLEYHYSTPGKFCPRRGLLKRIHGWISDVSQDSRNYVQKVVCLQAFFQGKDIYIYSFHQMREVTESPRRIKTKFSRTSVITQTPVMNIRFPHQVPLNWPFWDSRASRIWAAHSILLLDAKFAQKTILNLKHAFSIITTFIIRGRKNFWKHRLCNQADLGTT